VEAGAGGRGSARSNQVVPPVLKLGRSVASERYYPHYRLSLEPVGDSALSTPDWSI
jgi:hypothetical protein